jgi:hypothetical protein
MYTYNTNRRQTEPSTDRKGTEPEHREGKKPRKEGKGTKTELTPGNPSVLCPLPILSVRFLCVDEHTQGSPFREFLL